MHFNLLIPVFPVLWLNTIWIFPMSKFPSDPGFLLISAFVLLAQWSLCFLLFPNLSFLVGVLSVSLRFSSRVIYLKSVPVVPPITVIQILLPSGYCNISFGPHSPLSPAKANFHCPLSSLFSIYVNSVPPLTSASNSQLFSPVTSSALSPVLYKSCRKPAPSLKSQFMNMTRHNKEARQNVWRILFPNTIISNLYLVFFKICPPVHLCSLYLFHCTPRSVFAVTGQFSQHQRLPILV